MPVHICVNPLYDSKKEQLLQLADNFEQEGKILVKGSRNIIKTNYLEGDKVNIKYFKKPNFFNAIVYSLIRPSKARRSFEYAQYLLKNGILTPQPLAYIEEKSGAGLGESYYICRHIDYDFTFRELIHDPLFPNRKAILEQFTEFTYKMHEARINFLDHSPGNTLIVDKGDGNYDFYLIDLNRMKFEDMGIEARMDNFKKLWPSRTMVKIIAAKYAELTGKSYEELHAILLKSTLDFKRKITKKKYLKRKLKKK
ncbi:lipopolysaccharide kinase InaA family protein [Flavobacterium sp. J372]|uniref:lipopolysaccharide kinase InaA family protein n=1 Tax=Flavobacterium sp. J372 TaxID=2898436 RepID=UPI0021515FD6|nr:lipopolysaccharide kinase InaA family protein [Flavobacterium sp. J372]MCR5862148.1 lipopolysaccharide kinase InaA family protein [Flavobacterium sp. J372]